MSSREQSNMRDRALTRECEASCALLRRWLKPGDTVLTRVLHRSRSGNECVVGAWAVNVPEWTALYEAKEALVMARCGAQVSAESVDAAVRELHAATRPRTIKLFGHAARVLNRRADLDRGGVVYRGNGGMSATDELVTGLGEALYGDAQTFVNEEL